MKYRPGSGGRLPHASRARRSAAGPRRARLPHKRIDYARIATELRDPHAVLEAHPRRHRGAPPPREPLDPPRTPLERELAELWAALLNVPAVGIHDNFFELGGHSLLAVQLLSRVRQIHGVDLSLEVVYSGDFTVAELAKAIELKEIEQTGGGLPGAAARSSRPLRRRSARACWPKNRDAANAMRILLTPPPPTRRRAAARRAATWSG